MKGGNKDREEKVIELISGLVTLTTGMQATIKDLTTCVTLLKDRVEKLEAEKWIIDLKNS